MNTDSNAHLSERKTSKHTNESNNQQSNRMKTKPVKIKLNIAALVAVALTVLTSSSLAQEKKPNILFIVSDDTGYGDLGPYGGGEGRGMPTPNIDRAGSRRHDVLFILRAT